MKTLSKFAALVITMSLLSTFGSAESAKPAAAAPKNLVAGISGQVTGIPNWTGFSSLTLIPGAALFPVTSANTVLYLGFVGGSTADITNMVIYKTNRGSTKIRGVIPVKLGGVSNPSINLASTTVCPTQPLSTTNACVIRLDPTVLALSPLSDYYFVMFLPNDSNNAGISSAHTTATTTNLSGGFVSGTDESHLTVGQSIPAFTQQLDFLMYVMTN